MADNDNYSDISLHWGSWRGGDGNQPGGRRWDSGCHTNVDHN